VARDKTVLEAAREAVFAAPGRQVIAVSYDTGHDQSVQDMVLAVTDGLGGVDILVSAAARPNTGTMGIVAIDGPGPTGAPGGAGTARRALWRSVSRQALVAIRYSQVRGLAWSWKSSRERQARRNTSWT
jgi:NAD(P)-dependent dehydrogenase (short-subunit alcohol dehydrogenase family)